MAISTNQMRGLWLFGTIILMFGLVTLNYSLDILYPMHHSISTNNNNEIYIGEMGPGQTIGVDIDGKVSTGGIYGQGGSYDLAVVTNKPAGWSSENSKLYGRPLHITLTAPPNATEKTYKATVVLVNYRNAEKLKNITLTFIVKVDWNILNTTIYPKVQTVGINQPAKMAINVHNMGNAPDTFDISIGNEALGDKAYKTTVYIPPKKSKQILWERTWENPETYSFPVTIKSDSSPKLIKNTYNVKVDVVPRNLLSDYKATTRGIILFPIFENIIYGLSALIGSII